MSELMSQKEKERILLEIEYKKMKGINDSEDFMEDTKVFPFNWYQSDDEDLKIRILKEAIEKRIFIMETELYEKEMPEIPWISELVEDDMTLPKYLPVGTVVMLKGGKKRVMITSYCVVAKEDKDKIWDYGGCMFPEGIIALNQTCVFDHDQIQKIHHLGLVDEEQRDFNRKLFLMESQIKQHSIKDNVPSSLK